MDEENKMVFEKQTDLWLVIYFLSKPGFDSCLDKGSLHGYIL